MAAANQGATRKPAKAKKSAGRKKSSVKRPSAVKAKRVSAKARAAGKVTGQHKRPRGAVGGKQPEQPLIKALLAEHRHIASVMQLFVDQLKAIESGQVVDTHVVYEIMDYMVSWPDRFHHPREDLVYGRVAELDPGLADSVDSLQRDHDQTAKSGREVLRTIERWREGEVSGAVLVKTGRAYVDHMYQHMNIEEKQVFPQIEAVLTASDWLELAVDDQLEAQADPVFGPRVQRGFRNMARKLRRNLRRGVERGTLAEWVSIEAFMESLEVLSMAYSSVRSSAGEHVRAAWDDSLELYRESLLTAPWRCASNNTRLGMRLLESVTEIARDAVDDISRVNQERKDRIRLLDR
jgi:hemerythrin-like domain-containing protein